MVYFLVFLTGGKVLTIRQGLGDCDCTEPKGTYAGLFTAPFTTQNTTAKTLE